MLLAQIIYFNSKPTIHRLQLGIPGYLILFSILTFVPQRQSLLGKEPPLLVLLLVFKYFNTTLRIISILY